MCWFARAVLFVSLAAPAPALACGPCETGDPTLASPAWSLPYSGRVRLSFEGRWSSQVGDGIDPLRMDTVELAPSITGSPIDRLTLSLRVPVLWRRVAHPNLAVEEVLGLGDPEARVAVIVVRDRSFAPSHVVTASVAIDLPVGAWLGAEAAGLSHEARPSSGSADPSLAVQYAYRGPPWAVLASIGWRFPTTGTGGIRAGSSVEGALTVQWQPWPELAFRLGADARYALPTREAERVIEETGGFVLRAAPEIALAPIPDLYIALAARIPVVSVSRGTYEGPVVSILVAGEVGR